MRAVIDTCVIVDAPIPVYAPAKFVELLTETSED